MDDLLGHYEVELRRLAADAAQFAERHPAMAQRLGITGEGLSEDPQVERLLQAAALLNARASRHIEHSQARLTDALLQRLAPQYLRPLPSCSIAVFEPDPAKVAAGEPLTLPRGTMLRSAPVRGVRCAFRTAYELALPPLRVAGLRLRGRAEAPAGTPLPAGTTAVLSLQLALTAREATWPANTHPPLRLHLRGDALQVAALREALCGQALGALNEREAGGPWRTAEGCLPRPVGFADGEALIDAHAGAYRLLIEYFAFPAKFDFVDLPWPAALQASPAREVELHYALGGVALGSPQATLLQSLGPSNLLPGCTPVVNLFATRVKPLQDERQPARYTVLPDAQHPRGAEVYAIDRVLRGPEQPQPDEPLQTIPALLSWAYAGSGRGWVPRHDPGPEADDPAVIELVGPDGQPAPLQGGSLMVDVTATNANLPRELSIGHPGGDLVADGGKVCQVRLLQPPTPSRRFERRGEQAWQFISALKPNHLWLTGAGIEAVRELLRLHNLSRDANSERVVQSLTAIEARPAQAWMGQSMRWLARGTEVRLSIDDQRFGSTAALRLFAQVLERIFPLVAHRNSFTRLELISAQDARVLHRGDIRAGERPLL